MNKELVNKKTWQEFRETGLLWWINMVLHTFGWAIALEIDDGKIVDVFPARVRFRGFDNNNNSDGYIKVSEYIKNNATELLEESKE